MAQLWFNQNGDSTTGTPVAAGLPAPGSTPAQVAADPGFLIPGTTPSILQGGAGGPDVLPQEDPLMNGDRVQRLDGVIGTATGVALKTLPAQYQINWDDGTSSNVLMSDVGIVSRAINTTQIPTGPAPIEPDPQPGDDTYIAPSVVNERCNQDQYTIPGLDKCIDKTAALVLGAIALYLILNKKGNE